MADDFVEVSVSPEQAKALQAEMNSLNATPAPSPAPASATATVQDYLPPVASPVPTDIGPALGGFAKGLGQSLTGHIYAPEITPGEQGGANAGKWWGDLGTDLGTLGAGAATGAALGSVVPVIGTGVGAALGGGLALAGKHLLTNSQDQVHAHPERPINWGEAGSDALINGVLGAIAPGEGSVIKKALLDSAIGGAGGAALDASNQYFNNNGHVDANQVLNAAGSGALGGALLPLGLRGAGKALGMLKGGRELPTEQTSANVEQPQFERDPQTGLLRTTNTPEPPPSPPPGGGPGEPGILTGRVEYQAGNPETVPAERTPWDDAEDLERSPETGQPTASPQQTADVANENQESFSPDLQQVGQAQSAVDALRARQQQLQAVANENQEAFSPDPNQPDQAQAALDAIRYRNNQAQSVANENQESFSPGYNQMQGAQSAADQLRARQQALLQAQQGKAIQQKADEIHTKLTNYERLGAKSQVNKLKAEIAEQAASNPDPVQRAAYQRALDKYAPPEQPKAEKPLPTPKPILPETKVKIQGKVSKEGTSNEPQGEISNPQGQAQQPNREQFAQREEKTGQAGEQGTVEQGRDQETLNSEQQAKLAEGYKKAEKIRAKLKQEHGVEQTSEINTPDREHLRAEITQKVYGNGAPKKESRLDIVMGLPGSGKTSSVANKLAEKYGSLSLDADIPKEMIPEYENGNGTAIVNQESNDILNAVIDKAIRNKDNTVLGLVGRDINSLRRFIDTAKAKGYQVYLHHVDVPTETAIQRAHARFEETGRMSDPNYIRSIGLKPKENFDTLVKEGKLQGYAEYDNTTSKSAPPRIIRSSGAASEALGDVPVGSGSEQALRPTGSRTDETVKKKALTEGVDAIYPEKPYPTEPIFNKTKPQGTEQREHFLEAQAHKEGRFKSPEEIEKTPEFKAAWEKLTPQMQERLQGIVDAIIDKKKILTKFYNPGTETETGVLTKRSGHGQELYSPKGLSLSKKGDILVHGYNENAEISSRRLDRFSGNVEKTTETAYEGLYRHPSDINEAESFKPADAIVEQVANPILKKQTAGKPILESDYKKAAKNLEVLLQESAFSNPEISTPENLLGILKRLPEPINDYLKGNPCE